MEYRASLLAGHGFATLALAYCSFEDLPEIIDTIDLDYFEEALCYMLQHTQVLLMSFIILSRTCGEGVTLHSPMPSALMLLYSSFTDISVLLYTQISLWILFIFWPILFKSKSKDCPNFLGSHERKNKL